MLAAFRNSPRPARPGWSRPARLLARRQGPPAGPVPAGDGPAAKSPREWLADQAGSSAGETRVHSQGRRAGRPRLGSPPQTGRGSWCDSHEVPDGQLDSGSAAITLQRLSQLRTRPAGVIPRCSRAGDLPSAAARHHPTRPACAWIPRSSRTSEDTSSTVSACTPSSCSRTWASPPVLVEGGRRQVIRTPRITSSANMASIAETAAPGISVVSLSSRSPTRIGNRAPCMIVCTVLL